MKIEALVRSFCWKCSITDSLRGEVYAYTQHTHTHTYAARHGAWRTVRAQGMVDAVISIVKELNQSLKNEIENT